MRANAHWAQSAPTQLRNRPQYPTKVAAILPGSQCSLHLHCVLRVSQCVSKPRCSGAKTVRNPTHCQSTPSAHIVVIAEFISSAHPQECSLCATQERRFAAGHRERVPAPQPSESVEASLEVLAMTADTRARCERQFCSHRGSWQA